MNLDRIQGQFDKMCLGNHAPHFDPCIRSIHECLKIVYCDRTTSSPTPHRNPGLYTMIDFELLPVTDEDKAAVARIIDQLKLDSHTPHHSVVDVGPSSRNTSFTPATGSGSENQLNKSSPSSSALHTPTLPLVAELHTDVKGRGRVTLKTSAANISLSISENSGCADHIKLEGGEDKFPVSCRYRGDRFVCYQHRLIFGSVEELRQHNSDEVHD